MFFYGRNDLHGLAVCLFASTNVLLGVLGFYCCASLVRSDHHSVAHHIWTSAYVVTFAIATFGYDRAFYAGTSCHLQRILHICCVYLVCILLHCFDCFKHSLFTRLEQ